jgi:hypothetical protein
MPANQLFNPHTTKTIRGCIMTEQINEQQLGGNGPVSPYKRVYNFNIKIVGAHEIWDNGEFVTIVTESGTAIHLPSGAEHSISVVGGEHREAGAWGVDHLSVDLFVA